MHVFFITRKFKWFQGQHVNRRNPIILFDKPNVFLQIENMIEPKLYSSDNWVVFFGTKFIFLCTLKVQADPAMTLRHHYL